jgi:hypothetical protein
MIYVNGDSHSIGLGVDPGKSFAGLVAQHFNLELVNHAKVGASNQRIIRTTREFLAQNKPTLVLIGWSTWEREEWQYQGQYYNVNSSGHSGLPEELKTRYKQWVAEQTVDTVDIKSQHWHQKIYQLHQELEDQNISHLFFNCMYNFFKIKEPLNWGNNYLGPYNNDSSYYWYLRNQEYDTDKWYHFDKDGHQAWADNLIKFIKEKHLL